MTPWRPPPLGLWPRLTIRPQVRSPLPLPPAAQLLHQCLHPLPTHSRVSSARSFAALVQSWVAVTAENADVRNPGYLVEVRENLFQHRRWGCRVDAAPALLPRTTCSPKRAKSAARIDGASFTAPLYISKSS